MDIERYEKRAEDRFNRMYKVVESGCWEWQGFRDKHGYGYMSYQCKNHKAARYAYSHFVGPITEGLHLDHLCRNTCCVNPSHLEPVTPRENTLRGMNVVAINARKTHCHRGHPLTEDNIQRKNGRRICLECRKLYNKDTYARLYSAKANGGRCLVTIRKEQQDATP